MKVKKISFKQPILLLCIVDTVALTNFLVIIYKMINSLHKGFAFILLLVYAVIIALCTFLIFDIYNEQKGKSDFKRKAQNEKDYSINEKEFEHDLWALRSPTALSLYYCYHFSKETPTAESIVKLTVFAYNYFNIDNAPMNVNNRNCSWMRECFNKGFKDIKELKQIHEFPDYFDIDQYIASLRYINYLYQEMFKGTELPKKYIIY